MQIHTTLLENKSGNVVLNVPFLLPGISILMIIKKESQIMEIVNSQKCL